MRSVAAAADVNSALIHLYLGIKDQLFPAGAEPADKSRQVVIQLLAAGPRSEFPDRFVRYFIVAWRDPATGQALQAVLRRAVHNEASAALIRGLAENLLAGTGCRCARRAGNADSHHPVAPDRTSPGTNILRIKPLASASEDELVDLLAPVVRSYPGRKLWQDGAKDTLPRAEAWVRKAAPAISALLCQPG